MHRPTRPTLEQTIPNWLNDGIFSRLDAFNPPWKSQTDGHLLDLEYFGNRSGLKFVSPLVEKVLTETGLASADLDKLVALVWLRYGAVWEKRFATLSLEYDPIENYAMTETETTGRNETHIKGTSDTVSRSSTSHAQSAVYGMDSTTPAPSDTGDGTASGTDTTTRTGSDGDVITQTVTHTRTGNIGVTTSQEMITQERAVLDWQFFVTVYADVDEVFTVPIYGERRTGYDFGFYNRYVLPVASPDRLGGVKPVEKSADMVDDVGIDADGKLYVKPSEAGVSSVNGKTGEVTLNADDVGAPDLDDFSELVEDVAGIYEELPTKYSPLNPPPYPVTRANVPFNFGVDASGKYGYIKEGADTVTPFSAGGVKKPYRLLEYEYSTYSPARLLPDYETIVVDGVAVIAYFNSTDAYRLFYYRQSGTHGKLWYDADNNRVQFGENLYYRAAPGVTRSSNADTWGNQSSATNMYLQLGTSGSTYLLLWCNVPIYDAEDSETVWRDADTDLPFVYIQ